MPSLWDKAQPEETPSAPTTGKSLWGSAAATPTPANNVEQMVRDEAKAVGLDPEFAVRVARQESGFNPRARSSVGAMGVMQLMPGTAKEMGVGDPYDAAQNVRGGTRYLKQMLDQNHGDERLAAAAYNAGQGAVDKYHGVPPFSETQKYVQATATPSSGGSLWGSQPATSSSGSKSLWGAQPTANDRLTPPATTKPIPITKGNSFDLRRQPAAPANPLDYWNGLDLKAPPTRIYGDKPTVPKHSFLQAVGGILDEPFIKLNAYERGALTKSQSGNPLSEILNPQARAAGLKELDKASKLYDNDPAAANEEYGFNARKQNEAVAKSGNKQAADTAKYLLKHPQLAEAETFAAELVNPYNELTGAFAKPVIGTIGAFGGAAGKYLSKTPIGQAILEKASPFGAMVTQIGKNAAWAVNRGVSNIARASSNAGRVGLSISKGMDREQQYDIMRRAENLWNKANNKPPVPTKIADPTGELDKRAKIYYDFVTKMTEAQKKAGTLPENREFTTSFYHPMEGAYKDQHYTEEMAAAEKRLRQSQATASGMNVRKGSGGANGGHKTNLTTEDIVADQHLLKDNFDLGDQVYLYGQRRGKNVAVESMMKELQQKGVLPARRWVYKGYGLGEGEQGEQAVDKLADKIAKREAAPIAAAKSGVSTAQVEARSIRQRSLGAEVVRKNAARKGATVARNVQNVAVRTTNATMYKARAQLQKDLAQQQRLVDSAQARVAKAHEALAKGVTAARAKTLATEVDAMAKHTENLKIAQARVTKIAGRIAGEPVAARTPELSAAADHIADIALHGGVSPAVKLQLQRVYNRIKGVQDDVGEAVTKVGNAIPVTRLQNDLKNAMAAVSKAGVDPAGNNIAKSLTQIHDLMARSLEHNAADLDLNVAKIAGPAVRAEELAGNQAMRAEQAAQDAAQRVETVRASNAQHAEYRKHYQEAFKEIRKRVRDAIDRESGPHLPNHFIGAKSLSSVGSPTLRHSIVPTSLAYYIGDGAKGSGSEVASEILGGADAKTANTNWVEKGKNGIKDFAGGAWNNFHKLVRIGILFNPAIHPIGNVATNKSAALNEDFGQKVLTYGNALVDVALSVSAPFAKILGNPTKGKISAIVDGARAKFWGGAQAYAAMMHEAEERGVFAEFGQSGTVLGGDAIRVRGGRGLFQKSGQPLKAREKLDKILTSAQDFNQEATFGLRGEKRAAFELWMGLRKKFNLTEDEAAQAVREVVGNYLGVKQGDPVSKHVMFYPWLKSNTTFWTKIFLTHPGQWNAPEETARRQNEYADDPNIDDAKNPEGDFTLYDSKTGIRYRLPTAINMLSDVSAVVDPRGLPGMSKIPGMGVGTTPLEHLKAADKMLENRAYPEIRTLLNTIETVSDSKGRDPALPWNYRSVADRDAPARTQLRQLATYLIANDVPVPLVNQYFAEALRRGAWPKDPTAFIQAAVGLGAREPEIDTSVYKQIQKAQDIRLKQNRGSLFEDNAAQEGRDQEDAQEQYEASRDAALAGGVTP